MIRTIAIAALALIATSGLASARTIHSSKNNQAVASSPYNALNQYGNGAESQVFNHPGDNDMDRYHTNR